MKYLKSILGWILAVALWITYSVLLGFYLAWNLCQETDWGCSTFPRAAFSVIIPFIPFILIGACMLTLTRLSTRKGWDSKGYMRAAILTVSLLPIIWLMIDAPPIKNDYTLKDVALPGENVKASYDTLMTFRKNDGLKLNIKTPWTQWSNIPTNSITSSNDIEKAWEGIAEARKIVEKLNNYERIVDITPESPLDLETPVLDFPTFRTLARTYAAYAILRTEQGKPEEGIKELITFNSVVRKALPCAAIFIDKMIWIGISGINRQAAHRIALSPNCTTNDIRQLAVAFTPFTEEDISLGRVFLTEYLFNKNLCQSELIRNDLMGSASTGNEPYRKILSRLIYLFAFNPNVTINVFKTHYRLLLEGIRTLPPDVSAADDFSRTYSSKRSFKNLAGQFIVFVAIPSYSRTTRSVTKDKVLSDLLAIELHKKLGETLDLPDYISKGKYLTDEKTAFSYSVGLDGKAGTQDDIRLDER